MRDAFFTDSIELIQLFSGTNILSYEESKFFEGGMKAIEAFAADIQQNLVQWSTDKKVLLYKTNEYWYLAEPKDYMGSPVIIITRYSRTTYRRWTTWVNLSSVQDCIGKAWLLQEPQKSKFVRVFGD